MRKSKTTMHRRRWITGIGVAGVGLVALVGLLGAGGDSAEAAPVGVRNAVSQALFEGPPDRSAVVARAVREAGPDERDAIVGGGVDRDAYIRQAESSARCVREALGPTASTSDISFDGPRATYTIHVGGGRADGAEKVEAPSADVAVASRACYGRYLANVEAIWLAQNAPSASEWRANREKFLACLGAKDNVDSVSKAMLTELESGPAPGSCLVRFESLFEVAR